MSDNTPDKEQVELSPIQWMDKAIQSLYVQLPESVANDVSKRWEVVKIYLIGKVKDAFYYRDGHPRDGYLWSQFNSAHDLAASARYHQEPVSDKLKKYGQHLPTCNLNQNWQEAIDAMADTPNKFRDEDYYISLQEIDEKRSKCTCGFAEAILSETPSHEGKDAVAFAEWIVNNKWNNLSNGWVDDTQATDLDISDWKLITTEQLYSLYTESLKQQI